MFAIIYSASHSTDSEQFEFYKLRTNIHDGVWIGARAVILAGTEINEGCIIGANSVICSKECERNGIYAGVPGKMIKKRNIDKLAEQNILMYFR